MDYAAGYSLTPNWQAGASGYAYRQTTDDEVNGSAVPGGNSAGGWSRVAVSAATGVRPATSCIVSPRPIHAPRLADSRPISCLLRCSYGAVERSLADQITAVKCNVWKD